MDTALLVGALLLVAGLGALLHNEAMARFLAAEVPLQDIGVILNVEERMWAGIVMVAGLAFAMTGLMRIFT